VFLAHQLRVQGQEVTVYEKRLEEDNGGLGITISVENMAECDRIDPKGFAHYANRFTPSFRKIESSLGELQAEKDKSFDIVGVKRAALVNFFRDIARAEGAKIEYGVDIDKERVLAEKDNCDLLIGADGARSTVRSALKMGTSDIISRTPFVWLPVEGALPNFVRAVMPYENEIFYLSAYPDSNNSSTAVIEYSGETLDSKLADSERMITQEGIDILNNLFEARLYDCKFTRDRSKWTYFQGIASNKTHDGNVYLIGDAFARIHYRSGAGALNAMVGATLLRDCLFRDKLADYDGELRNEMGSQVGFTMEQMGKVEGMGKLFRQYGPKPFFAAMMGGYF